MMILMVYEFLDEETKGLNHEKSPDKEGFWEGKARGNISRIT